MVSSSHTRNHFIAAIALMATGVTLLFFVLLVGSLFEGTLEARGGGQYSCKSPSGQNVDWFVAYKLPILEGAARGTMLKKGTAYLYADARNPQWVLSEQGIDMKESNIGATVSQMFVARRTKEHAFAIYNDEHPGGQPETGKAHMKGVLVFDESQGFWLIHSVPNFPTTKLGSYLYPDPGKKYGQSFLCITTSSSASLDNIGKQLFYAQPSWYEHQLPSSFASRYPMLAQAINGVAPPKGGDLSSIVQLRSLGGQSFTSFSKNKKWAKDLYADLVAQELRVSLYVETWLNGGGKDLPSECNTPNKVFNLRGVHPANYKFASAKDHSKWAVSKEDSPPWICIGDINRQKSQEGRGGGTVCLNDAPIVDLYRRSVGDAECCGNSTRNDDDFASNLRTANNDLDSLEAPLSERSFTHSAQGDCVIMDPTPQRNKVQARGKKMVPGRQPNRTVKKKPAAIKGKGRMLFYRKLRTEIDF